MSLEEANELKAKVLQQEKEKAELEEKLHKATLEMEQAK